MSCSWGNKTALHNSIADYFLTTADDKLSKYGVFAKQSKVDKVLAMYHYHHKNVSQRQNIIYMSQYILHNVGRGKILYTFFLR